jgi:predicted outer membrane repeat protein
MSALAINQVLLVPIFLADFQSDTYGGAVHSLIPVQATATTFYNNSAMREGAAVYLTSVGTLTCNRCTFANNTASKGGAISGNGAGSEETGSIGLSITNSSFRFNSATRGGAIDLLGTLNASNTDFLGNTADTGGAVYLGYEFDYTPLSRFSSCQFSENRAGTLGGGLAFDTVGGVSVQGCMFEGNTAGSSGAGIALLAQSGPLNISRCVFTANKAASGGGGALALLHTASPKHLKVQGSSFIANKV